MKRFSQIAVFLLALPGAWGQANTFESVNRVDPAEPPESLVALRDSINERGAIQASFVEQRRITFKRDVIELRGKLAYSPELGLSLHYLEPEERRIVLTKNSIIREDEDGKVLEQRIPKRYAALQAVLTLDVDALADDFLVYFAPGTQWQFGLRDEGETRTGPRRSVGSTSESILVSGTGSIVERIELERSGSMKVIIELSDIRELTDDDVGALKQFFNK